MPSFSRRRLARQSDKSSSLYSLDLDMLLDTRSEYSGIIGCICADCIRSSNESTSMVDSLSFAIIYPETMEPLSTTHLVTRPERLWCLRLREGKQNSGDCWVYTHWHNIPSVIGIGEIVLLPLDVLKIKRQTNPEAFRGRGVVRIVKDEGFGLYRGWQWTAARNAPGSFAVSISNIFHMPILICA